MIFSVTTKEFQDALKAVNLLKKTQSEGNDQLVLSAVNKDCLLIERFSVNIRFQVKVPACFKELGKAVVSLPQLLDVFKKPTGDISCFKCDSFNPNLKDQNKMTIEIDGDSFKVQSFNPDDTFLYPWLMKKEPVVGGKIRLSTISLEDLFKRSLPCCVSPEDGLGRPVFEHIHLYTEGNNLVACSCDTHRFAIVKSQCFVDNSPNLDALIPFHIAKVASKLLKKANDAFLWQTNSIFYFKIDNFILSAERRNPDDFPDLNQYLMHRRDNFSSALFDANELRNAFDKLAPFAKKDRYKTVCCQFLDDSLRAFVKDDAGNIVFQTSVTAADFKSNSPIFGINAYYMRDALTFLDSPVRISFFSKDQPLIIAFEQPLFSSVTLISLVRIKD